MPTSKTAYPATEHSLIWKRWFKRIGWELDYASHSPRKGDDAMRKPLEWTREIGVILGNGQDI